VPHRLDNGRLQCRAALGVNDPQDGQVEEGVAKRRHGLATPQQGEVAIGKQALVHGRWRLMGASNTGHLRMGAGHPTF